MISLEALLRPGMTSKLLAMYLSRARLPIQGNEKFVGESFLGGIFNGRVDHEIGRVLTPVRCGVMGRPTSAFEYGLPILLRSSRLSQTWQHCLENFSKMAQSTGAKVEVKMKSSLSAFAMGVSVST